MKKVSVIIPIYNTECYLEKCLDSVIGQTYNNLEIILVDDGSTDSSPAICDNYAAKDSRISVIHKKNGGVSSARNIGIDASTGDYLFFIDGDDYIEPECISLMVNEQVRGYFPIVGYKLDIPGSGVVDVNQTFARYESTTEFLKDFNKYFATKFSFVWGKLFDASIVKGQHLTFPTDIMLGEDMLFNIKYYACYSGKISTITHCGYIYRQSGGSSLSKKFDSRMFDWNEYAYNELKDYLSSQNVLDNTNHIHLMNNIFGNYMYGFRLIALSNSLDSKQKCSLIRRYRSTPIFLESMNIHTNSRIDTKLFTWLISRSYLRTYILLEKLKYRIRK